MPLRFPFLYVDAFSGASGDMFLGALVDLGYPFARLQRDVAALKVAGIRLRKRAVLRQGIAATRIEVVTAGEQPHRGRREIRALLRRAQLAPAVRQRSLAVFERIIEVEAALHGIPQQRVHLHEVGALDALADVVGTIPALHHLEVQEVQASPVNVGSGRVTCAHGEMPVPAPATAALLRDIPVYGRGTGEKTTPTGAALLAVLANRFGPLPMVSIAAIGQGAGSRDDADAPNLLRLLAGDRLPAMKEDTDGLLEIRCQIDDMDPRLYGHLMERLLEEGARDVFLAPIQMKKNRPGTLVEVLADTAVAAHLGRVLLDETPALGYRYRAVHRVVRRRQHVTVKTPFGAVRVKVADDDEGAAVATPEYDDCRKLARQKGIPLRQVVDAARAAWGRRRRTRSQ